MYHADVAVCGCARRCAGGVWLCGGAPRERARDADCVAHRGRPLADRMGALQHALEDATHKLLRTHALLPAHLLCLADVGVSNRPKHLRAHRTPAACTNHALGTQVACRVHVSRSRGLVLLGINTDAASYFFSRSRSVTISASKDARAATPRPARTAATNGAMRASKAVAHLLTRCCCSSAAAFSIAFCASR